MSSRPTSSSSDSSGAEASTGSRGAGPALACAVDAFDKRLLGVLQRVNAVSTDELSELLAIVFNLLHDSLDASSAKEDSWRGSRLLVAAYAFFFRQCLRHDLPPPAVFQDLLTAQLQREHAQVISDAFKHRRPALRETFIHQSHRNSFAPLNDFDWNLHLQMGGDTVSVAREPLLIVALDVQTLPKKHHQEVVFELDRPALDSLIANLERAQATAAQISV